MAKESNPSAEIKDSMKEFLGNMQASLQGLKDSIGLSAKDSTLQKNNVISMETNNILTDMLETMKEQLASFNVLKGKPEPEGPTVNVEQEGPTINVEQPKEEKKPFSVFIETNNILTDMLSTMQAQFAFFKGEAAKSKFEGNQREDKKSGGEDASITEKPKGNSKIGGILGALGIGLKGLSMGLMAFANPAVIAGGAIIIGLITALGLAIGFIVRTFGNDIANFVGNIIKAIGEAFVYVAALVGKNEKFLKKAIDVVFYFVDSLIESFGKLLRVVWPYLSEFLDKVVDFAMRLVNVAADLIKALMPYLIQFVEIVADTFLKILDIVAKFIKDILPDLNKLVDIILDAVVDIIDIFVDLIKDLMPYIVEIVDIFADLIKDIMPYLVKIVDILTDSFTKIVKLLAPIIDRIVGVFDNMVDGIREIARLVAPIIQSIVNAFDNLIEGIREIARLVVPIINNLIDSFDRLVASIERILTKILDSIQPILQEIRLMIQEVGDSIRGIITDTLGGVENIVNSLGENLRSLVTESLGAIENLVKGIGDTIIEVLNGVTRNIKELAEIDGRNMLETAAGITAIAGAIAAFGVASAAGAAGSAVGDVIGGISKLFGGEGSVLSQLKQFADVGEGLDRTTEAIYGLLDALSAFGGITADDFSGFTAFTQTISDGIDTIVDGGWGEGSTAKRVRVLEALASMSGDLVVGSPERTGSRIEEDTSRVESTRMEMVTPAPAPPPNLTSANNVSDSFNTNQVFVSPGSDTESTLDRIFATE